MLELTNPAWTAKQLNCSQAQKRSEDIIKYLNNYSSAWT